MRWLAVFISFLFLGGITFAQRTKTVTAQYTFYAPETMPIIEAKRIALERAQIKAIAEEFGTIISQSNSNVVTTNNGETDSHFFSLGTSDVKGEWIETIGEPKYDKIIYKDHLQVVTCTVKGKIRELLPVAIDYEVYPLCNGTDPQHRRLDFLDGDSFFLSFESPYSGYLTVYFVDFTTETAFCILPYRISQEPLLKVDKNKRYVFFSPDNAPVDLRAQVDEFKMTCSSPSSAETNQVYVVFSDRPFSIPNIKFDEDGLKYLSFDNFQKWTTKLRQNNNNVLIKNYSITIKK